MTGSELVHMSAEAVVSRDTVDGWIAMIGPTAQLAEQIALTEFVPASLRGKPAAITAAILYGREIGLGPIQSLQSVDVIEGRPGISAEMARALTLAAGHELLVTETTTTRCVVRGKRSNGSDWVEVVWTIDDAKRAGLDGRQNWRKHPRRMLQARATAELCHLLFSDAIGGMPFLLEEAADDSDVSAGTGEAATAKRTAKRKTPVATPADSAPPLPGDEPELPGDDPAEETGEAVTKAQVTKIQTAFSALGVTDREVRLMNITTIVNRPVASTNDLTKAEAHALIDTLEKLGDGEEGAAKLRVLVGSATSVEEAEWTDASGEPTDPKERARKLIEIAGDRAELTRQMAAAKITSDDLADDEKYEAALILARAIAAKGAGS